MDTNSFRDYVYSAFYKYLGVSFESTNISIKEKAEFEKNKQIFIYQLSFKYIIITAPFFLPKLSSALQNEERMISAITIKRILDSEELEVQDKYQFSYLNPSKFVFRSSPQGFSIRELNPSDGMVFNQFENACKDADKQAGAVSLDDSVVFGGFYSRKLVAAATYSLWGDILADIAVLTHPKFRNRGLGKAVLSKLCRWGIQRNRISQYCCNVNNSESIYLAKSLGFEKLIELDRLKSN